MYVNIVLINAKRVMYMNYSAYLPSMGFIKISDNEFYKELNGFFINFYALTMGFEITTYCIPQNTGTESDINRYLMETGKGENFEYADYFDRKIKIRYSVTDESKIITELQNALNLMFNAASKYLLIPVCMVCGKPVAVKVSTYNGKIGPVCDSCKSNYSQYTQFSSDNMAANTASYVPQSDTNYGGVNTTPYTPQSNTNYGGVNTPSYVPQSDTNYGGTNTASYAPQSNTNYGGANTAPYTPQSNTNYGGANTTPYTPQSNTNYGGANTAPYTPQSNTNYGGTNTAPYTPQSNMNYGGVNTAPYTPQSNMNYGGTNTAQYTPQSNTNYGGANTPLYKPQSNTNYGTGYNVNNINTSSKLKKEIIISVLGGIGGGLLGAVLWILFSFAGLLCWISGMAAGYIALLVPLCMGSQKRGVKIALSVLSSLLFFGIGMIIGFGVDIYVAFEGGLTFGEALQNIPAFLTSQDIAGGFLRDVGIGMLTYVVGALIIFFKRR